MVPCDNAGGAVVAHAIRPTTGHTVFTTDVAGTAPTSTTPLVVTVGDVYVNTVDKRSWIYGPDPTDLTGITMAWIPVHQPTGGTVTITPTAKVVPGTPAAGETAYTPALVPVVGDVFINRIDGITWIRALDPVTAAPVWEPLSAKAVVTRSAIIYVGTAPFNAAAVAGPLWGMDPDTQPSPALLEPAGGDIYISTRAGDIAVLAGPPPSPTTFTTGKVQHVYVGAGAFNPVGVAAPTWGMPAGTLPDPATLVPAAGDVYFDTIAGDVAVLA
jgi:hypothetical protein